MDDFYCSQLRTLNEQKQYRSAEYLGSFFIKTNPSPNVFLEYGNALFGCKEYLRASVIYENLFEQITGGKEKLLTSQQVTLAKVNCAQCYKKLKKNESAVAMLKSISLELHTVETLMLWAKIVTEAESKRAAIAIYKEVVKRSPFCIEAVTALVDLGSPLAEIMPKQQQQQIDWMPDVFDAIRLTNKPDLTNPVPIPEPTMNRIGSNLHILLASAVLHLRQGENEKALAQYSKIRQADRRFVTDMDGLAWLLLKRGDTASLLTLCTDLMKAAPTRHEGWAASAAYYYLKGTHEMVQECIARATALGPLSPYAWLIRGETAILSTHASAISFRTSWVLLRSFPAAEGLINALFMRDELQKSLIVANDVMKVAGSNSARAWALRGRVAMKDPKTRDQAQKDLEKALQLDENCLQAVVSLAELSASKKDLMKAQQMHAWILSFRSTQSVSDGFCVLISSLEKHIARKPHEMLFVALGQVQIEQEKHADAIQSFNAALALNQFSKAALAGISKVDEMIRLVQGGDDNDGEEDDDNDDDDDDEDDDDGEF